MASPNAKTSQLAAVCHGAIDLRIEERSIPQPGPGQALIEVALTGLCGSDLHYYNHGANGIFKIQAPMVLGHEAGGIVTALGPDQPAGSTLQVGDRVAMEVGQMCKTCQFCKKGRYNLCQGMRFASSAKTFPHLDGTLQEFMVHPTELLYKLPDSATLAEAALAEPLAVVLHAFRRASVQPGARVLVLGAGAVGLLACSLARASGATQVIAVDIEQAKLDFALEQGWATGTYALPKGPRVSGLEAIEASKGGWEGLKTSEAVKSVEGLEAGFDLVLECTGVEMVQQLAVQAALPGSTVMCIGMGNASLTLPTGPSLLREVDIKGSFRYANCYPDAIALLGSGRLGAVSKMFSHEFSLEDSAKAFEAMKSGKGPDGKPIIKPVIRSGAAGHK